MGAVYNQLSIKERVQIGRWRLAKIPVHEIARVLNARRPRSTVKPGGTGSAMKARRDMTVPMAPPRDPEAAKRRAGHRNLIWHPELHQQVVDSILRGWTPEQIGNWHILDGARQRVSQALPGRVSPQAMSREEDDLSLHPLAGRHGPEALVVSAGASKSPPPAPCPQTSSAEIRPRCQYPVPPR